MGNKILKFSIVIVICSILFVGCGNKEEGKLVIGGKNFTEQDILVNLFAELIESNTDIEVERKAYLGGTNVVAQAIESGSVDIYPEYTGTALMSILDQDVITDSKKAYEKVKNMYAEEKQIEWLKPLGFNNAFALAMTQDKANKLGISKISDVKPFAKDFKFISNQEFLERDDGYKNFKVFYDMEFNEVKGLDHGLVCSALKENEADISITTATDGRIPAFGLIVLKDDKSFFPPYDAAPIVRKDTIKKYPEIKKELNKLAGKLTDAEMAKLNAQVDVEQKDAKTVAKDWLIENSLIEK